MSVTHFTTNGDKTTTGLSRERLASLTWARVAALTGLQRTMLLNDLDRYDLRPSVRLNPLVFARWTKATKDLDLANVTATGLTTHLGELYGEIELTEAWRELRPASALRLWLDHLTDPTLGGPYMVEVLINDGHGGKMTVPQARQGFPDLLEFRMPCEAPTLVVATY